MSDGSSPSPPSHVPATHQNRNTSQLRRKLRRRRNPFSQQETTDRENFPNIDSFFNSSLGQPETDNNNNNNNSIQETSFSSHDGMGQDHDIDGGSSVLNMSIGARAALTEHLRFVAKHGIDGDGHGQEPFPDEVDGQNPRSVLDEQWDYLMEGPNHLDLSKGVDTSTDASFSRTNPRVDIFPSTPSCLEQSIEVMTDVSQDFFNSSRVHNLATPERNRSKRHHVVTRDQVHEGEDDDSFQDGPGDTLAPELWILQSSSSGENNRPANTNSSFQSNSFCVPDISRISSADDSEHRAFQRSPNPSFLPLQPLVNPPQPNIETDSGFGPLFLGDVASPLRYPVPLDSSFASIDGPKNSPRSSPPSSSLPPLNFRPSPTNTEARTSILSESRRQEVAHKLRRQSPGEGKENSQPSPSSTEGISTLKSALDTMPKDFLKAIESARTEAALSPISQVGSHHFGLFNESSSSSSRRRRRPNPPKDAATENAHDISTSSSSSHHSLTGRKRYRTVVPRRVYMDSPSQFPEEQDSFASGTPSPESSGGNTQRSLLDSFEAVATKD